MNLSKVEQIMAVSICIALCFQRLSMAMGSIFWSLSIICFLYLFYKAYKAGEIKERAKNFMPYYKVILFMLLCYIPSIVVAGDFKHAIKDFSEMWIYRLMPFYMVTLFLHNKKWLEKIMVAFIIATSLDCLVAAWQVYGMHEWRGWGFGGHSLNLASLLCLMVPLLSVFLMDDEFSPKIKYISKIALICCVIGLIAGKSRGAWLTLSIVLPLVSCRYILKSRKVLIICLVIVMAIGMGFASSKQYQKRLVSITNTTTDVSNADRIRVWKSCFNMIEDHPIAGVGIGKFVEAYNSGGYRLKETVQDLNHSHNNIMQIWTETGTVGIIGFLTMSLFILFRNFKDWLKDKNPYSLIMWSSWLGFMIFGMFDLIIDHSAITKFWWFLLGTLLVFKQSKDERGNNDRRRLQ